MFVYCYDVMESKGQKGRIRPHKGQKTVTYPRAFFNKMPVIQFVQNSQIKKRYIMTVCSMTPSTIIKFWKTLLN